MLDDRKAAILRVVVEEYIETAQPVGSAMVARLPELAVSSATVRNEMGVLEREGYLVQPHTSAGRIPTDKGYRFFVDSLTKPGPLDAAQNQQVREFFARAHGELEKMLHDTSRLLSSLTDYAAVVIAPSHEAATIRSVQLVGLGSAMALLVVVLSNGAVEKRSLELGSDVTDAAARGIERPSVVAPGGPARVGSTFAVLPPATASSTRWSPTPWRPWLVATTASPTRCSWAARPAWPPLSMPSAPSARCCRFSSSSTWW